MWTYGTDGLITINPVTNPLSDPVEVESDGITFTVTQLMFSPQFVSIAISFLASERMNGTAVGCNGATVSTIVLLYW